MIFENRAMKNKLQKVFCSNYLVYKYFLLNPKALEAPFSRRSNAPSNIQIRQKLAKLSKKPKGMYLIIDNRLGQILSEHSVYGLADPGQGQRGCR